MERDLDATCEALIRDLLNEDVLERLKSLTELDQEGWLEAEVGPGYQSRIEEEIGEAAQAMADRYREDATDQIEVSRIEQGLRSYRTGIEQFWIDFNLDRPDHCFSALEQFMDLGGVLNQLGRFPAAENLLFYYEDAMLEWMRRLAGGETANRGGRRQRGQPLLPPLDGEEVLRGAGASTEGGQVAPQARAPQARAPQALSPQARARQLKIEYWDPAPTGVPEDIVEVDLRSVGSGPPPALMEDAPKYIKVAFESSSPVYDLISQALVDGETTYIRVDLPKREIEGLEEDEVARTVFSMSERQMRESPEILSEEGNDKIAEHVQEHVLPKLNEPSVQVLVEVQHEERSGQVLLER